jgi:transcriptional regulator with XRE-family HTH domain
MANRLKQLRNEKRLSLNGLSEAININKSTLSRIETGLREPKQEYIDILCSFFDVSADYFLCRSDIRRSSEIAAASSDIPYDDLPPEAIEELEQYKEFLKQKYGKKK